MESLPVGYAYIISNRFSDTPSHCRQGADIDENNLKKLFEWLRFDVRIKHDLTDKVVIVPYSLS